jgi:hypothetical protein
MQALRALRAQPPGSALRAQAIGFRQRDHKLLTR